MKDQGHTRKQQASSNWQHRYLDLASQNQSKNAPGTGQGLRFGSHAGSRTSHRDEGRDENMALNGPIARVRLSSLESILADIVGHGPTHRAGHRLELDDIATVSQ